MIELTPQLTNFNAVIWKYKKEKCVALSQELTAMVYAPRELEVFKDDLVAMHRIKELRFIEPPKVEIAGARRLNDDTLLVEKRV